ncbi:MAG: DNA-directed RNA polymerase subunit beta [Bacteroidetes bacterium]|nr:DNA-directed RNA polymerase subunit beta [Bacteroidota bacterium]
MDLSQFKRTESGRINFSKIEAAAEFPDLLSIQVESFKQFIQDTVPPDKRNNVGLQRVFQQNFPIFDNRENYILEFVEYYIDKPKYSVIECIERGLTFAVPLKAKLRLSTKDESGNSSDYIDTIEQEVYLGNLPYMTEKGTFIINGAERVIVSQLHRSPGVFFGESVHPNGTKLFSARIIPFRGSWVEFTTDVNDVMFAYIDRKKKFHITTLLRALGYPTNESIYDLFHLVEAVKVKSKSIQDYIDRMVITEVVDQETGEMILDTKTPLTAEIIDELKKAGVDTLKFLKAGKAEEFRVIVNTLNADKTFNEESALDHIYKQLRSGDAPDLETAKNVIERLFFSPKRYDLGDVGRYRINKKLGLNIPIDVTVLTREDIILIIHYLIDLKNNNKSLDDIDHLGNRRVRTVGEQLAAQFSVGLARMARTIKERMNLRDNESFAPQDLVNARTVSSVINAFFGTNQLSQFMDQTNPLAELTHKRRLSALGPGGLTRDRAGFEVRDVHYTHYGRLCPIETPEGPNIGLISSLCIYAKINDFGFIETPYRVVNEGKVQKEIIYLDAEEEEDKKIAQANAPLKTDGQFVNDRIKCRLQGDFPVLPPDEVELMDVAPNQIVSAAASLIPFLEHDDANRALMGSNMQRQAVPLLRPESPIVGTGLEWKVAKDSKAILVAEGEGEVIYVDANEIHVRYDRTMNGFDPTFADEQITRYRLLKFHRTNQDTCVNQRPIVRPGQKLHKGDVLADSSSTQEGELALGRNVLVAFMPWRGYNFEDAIIISERLVAEDVFTSIHVEEFELQVRDTKRGEEELTREIPNVSEEATRNLDENGIIRVGAEVYDGDIIIGKITPKGETDPTPEEKLLRAIFGDKAGDVKDASLKATPGLKGIVIGTKLFSRKKKDAIAKKEEKNRLETIEREFSEGTRNLYVQMGEKLGALLTGKKSSGIYMKDGETLVKKGAVIKTEDFRDPMTIADLDLQTRFTDDASTNEIFDVLVYNFTRKLEELEDWHKREKFKLQVGDELPPGIVQLAKVYVAKKRKLSVGDKMAGRHGNKGVVSKIVPVEDMPFMEDGTPVDIILNPLGVPSRMNLGQIYETSLGWAGKKLGLKFATPIFDGATFDDVQNFMKEAGLKTTGKTTLRDGRTGEKFDNDVTVGILYMLKLSHLVDDKIHARSIGPYSLITQQPLGGKAQFGGQRFGEMEVWALEAYGAANVLQEILTVKSDDVSGRSKVYEAIVKGENLPDPSTPESFNVLVRELQGLGLEVNID